MPEVDHSKDSMVLPLGHKAQPKANERQVDGTHYVKYGDFQPWDTWVPWDLNGFQAEVQKLVVRYKHKNGTKDLRKAIHYLEKLIEIEEANGGDGRVAK